MKTQKTIKFNDLTEQQKRTVISAVYERECENREQHIELRTVSLPIPDNDDIMEENTGTILEAIKEHDEYGLPATHAILVIDNCHWPYVVGVVPYILKLETREHIASNYDMAYGGAVTHKQDYLDNVADDALDMMEDYEWDDEATHQIETGGIVLEATA